MFSSDNVFMVCLGMDRNIQPWPHGKDDCMLSYLPAAHSYQYSMECYFGLIGGSIGFYQVLWQESNCSVLCTDQIVIWNVGIMFRIVVLIDGSCFDSVD